MGLCAASQESISDSMMRSGDAVSGVREEKSGRVNSEPSVNFEARRGRRGVVVVGGDDIAAVVGQ